MKPLVSLTWITVGIGTAAVFGCSSAVSTGSGGDGGKSASTTATGVTSTGALTTSSGGDNTAECEKLIHADCAKIFQCAPSGTPDLPNEQACESKEDLDCMGPSNCALDSSKIDTCAADLAALSCTGSTFMVPPSCDTTGLCQTTGQPYCLGTDVGESGGTSGSGGAGGGNGGDTCTLTLSKCSDGNTYEVDCGTTCTCTINGASPKVVPSTGMYCGSQGKKNAIAACGWNIYFQ